MPERVPSLILVAVLSTLGLGRFAVRGAAAAEDAQQAKEKCKLTIVAVPADVEAKVRVNSAAQLREKAKRAAAASLLFGTGPHRPLDLRKLMFNAAFMGVGMKPPIELRLPPGDYFVSVELTDKPKTGDKELGEMFRRQLAPPQITSPLFTMSFDKATGSRRVRICLAMLKLEKERKDFLLPLHLLPTRFSLKEALTKYAPGVRFKLDPEAKKELEKQGVTGQELQLAVAGLKRGGVVYVPKGKNGGFLAQVRADGSLVFYHRKVSQEGKE